jgi:hypothetical protein
VPAIHNFEFVEVHQNFLQVSLTPQLLAEANKLLSFVPAIHNFEFVEVSLTNLRCTTLTGEVEKVVNATATAELEHPAYNSLIIAINKAWCRGVLGSVRAVRSNWTPKNHGPQSLLSILSIYNIFGFCFN